jgi:flagellar basal body rod protein FlgB
MANEGIEAIKALSVYDSTFVKLEEAINKAAKKQAVISQNIANINNPNYEALEFDEILNKAVKRANKKVILEEEMASLSRNSISHSAYVKLLASKVNALHSVVTQGRK